MLEMLELRKLSKAYKAAKGTFFAAKDIDLNIGEDEIVGLIGDSGSGKSTIAQMIAGLIKPSSGEIVYKGDILSYPIQKKYRPKIQILFQHPEVSFNPKLKIISSMKEVYNLYKKDDKDSSITADIAKFGLKEEHLHRYPSELSGGELQRLALARVLAVKPSLLILDEPSSMLDVITQAQIIDILREYKKEHHCSYLFISHNEILAEVFCDRIITLNRLLN